MLINETLCLHRARCKTGLVILEPVDILSLSYLNCLLYLKVVDVRTSKPKALFANIKMPALKMLKYMSKVCTQYGNPFTRLSSLCMSY
jgi:hypothetical protein